MENTTYVHCEPEPEHFSYFVVAPGVIRWTMMLMDVLLLMDLQWKHSMVRTCEEIFRCLLRAMNDQCSLSELQLMLLFDDSDVFRFVWLTICYVCLLENLLAMFSGIRWRWCLTTGIRGLWEDWLMTQCTDKCFHFFICVIFAEDHWQNRTFLLFFWMFCFVRAIPPRPFFLICMLLECKRMIWWTWWVSSCVPGANRVRACPCV